MLGGFPGGSGGFGDHLRLDIVQATEQIGADELQKQMDEAERAYDGGLMRKALGGKVEEEIKKQMIASGRPPSLR